MAGKEGAAEYKIDDRGKKRASQTAVWSHPGQHLATLLTAERRPLIVLSIRTA